MKKPFVSAPLLTLITSFLITSSLLAQVPDYVPTDGLIGYWPFNGNANDESANNLSINNYFVQFTNDPQRGMVASFNGNSWLESDTSLFQTQTPITIQFWAKSSNNYSMDVIGQACGNDCGDDIRVQLNAAQCNSTGLSFKSPAFFATAPAQTDNNQWHLYTLIMGNNNNFSYSNFQFFIDGLFIAIGPAQCSHNWGGWAYNPNPSYHFSIGKGGPLGYYFNGLLDDITIYNRALTPEEITALYNGTTTIPGCTNTTACNYNAYATQDDGSCTFPSQTYLNCAGDCLNDANSNGICDEVETNLPSYLPANGLVAWYPFNGNANDESGNGNNGTVNGATLTTDRNGNANSAYSFDGHNDEIRVVHTNELNLSGEFSISSWYRTMEFPTTNNSHTIISKRDDQLSCCSPNVPFHLSINYTQNGLDFRKPLMVSANGNYQYAESQYQVNLNQWTAISVTFSNDYCKFFINGAFFDSIPFQNSQRIPNSNDLIIGSINRAYGDEYMNGQLDDIAIYNRALTQEEISALYNGTTNNNNSENNNNTALTAVPAGISYQAVARNAQGTALDNTAVQVKFTLITDSLSGTTEYVETHSLSTNSLGLFSTAFGTGTPVTGTWAGINWTHSNKYLKVELDAGNGFVDLGTQQLLSSPFAIRAQSAATIENGDLPIFADNAAAIAGGLTVGKLYRNATGDLKVVY